MMSDTPRTDTEVESEDIIGHYGTNDPAFQIHRVPVEFARQLELELIAAQKMNIQLRLELEQRDKDYENLQALM